MKVLASRIWAVTACALLLVLGACSGGDSGNNDVPPPPAISGVLSTGVITGFGSVYLNGARYDTTDAAVTMDDQAADMSQLRVGQYIELKGHEHGPGDLDAELIRYHNVLEGPISSIDAGADSFVAMGQTVRVSFDTVFGDDITPASVDGLAVGEVVEVSGLVPEDGMIDATRIDLKPDGGPYDVTGYVTRVSIVEHRFNLNGLVVDYSTANMEDFTTGDPAAGDLVLVKGFTFLADGAFLAIRVELRSEDRLAAGPSDLVAVEGMVASFVSVTDFEVAGWKVTTTASTEYEHGTSADLANDVHVFVKGGADATGALVAHKIAFREVSEIRVVAQVGAIAPYGELVLLGLEVATTDTTIYRDMSVLSLRDFGLDDVVVGSWLDVRGYEEPAGSGRVVATHVVRIDPPDGVRLRGPFRDPAPPSFDILSVRVSTSDATRFLLEGNTRISAAEFFSQASGELVEAWGTWSAPVLSAQRVEIKTSGD
jgi:hypothetical protein